MYAAFDTTYPVALRGATPRSLYFSLMQEGGAAPGQIGDIGRSASRQFLTRRLELAAGLDVEFPDDPRALPQWLASGNARTSQGYRDYLDQRQAGASRRFFKSRSHAMHFIRAVAPTKLVDGAWLYGLLPRWQDPRLSPLIRTYLEELGEGVALRNHVLLYRQLLARYDCNGWQDLPDENFVQGSVQLALAHHAAEFLPEVIGFNLGYEQLPLHLPITAYELNELDIDPYYFALHMTIDNASTGHARMALQSVLDFMPRFQDPAEFYRRVANGYRLNDVGMGTVEAIATFDMDREVQALFADKAKTGARLHSDYCRIGGRTVTDWLSTPGQIPALLDALQSNGWIQRGRDPQHSRFWRLLTDTQAPMFGVFDAFEQQLIRDWIWDGVEPPQPSRAVNRFRQRPSAANAGAQAAPHHDASVAEVLAFHLAEVVADGRGDDPEFALLVERLEAVSTKAEAMAALQGLLSPANHWTPVGLLATRICADLLNR